MGDENYRRKIPDGPRTVQELANLHDYLHVDFRRGFCTVSQGCMRI